jgi:ATP-dependent protease ClpP protease subunit
VADETPRYRFRGSVKPTAEVKRPVNAYRNAESSSANGSKSTSATIDIFDVIDSWGGWWGISAAEVDAALAKVGKVDTLYVRVNSPGGEATEGVAIANLLRAHAATVNVTNYGLAASAASFIAIAGDSLSMAPGSLLMIHEAWNGMVGSADDFRAEAGVLDTMNESIAALYALKAGGGTAKWRALMKTETWYTPEAAVEIKLADKVGIDVAPGVPVLPDETEDDPDIEVDVTVEITPAARAAQRFDLSVFRHVPEPIAAFAAHKPPAEPPEKPPTIEEAVTMTPTDKALRERLGLAEDADESAVNARIDELRAAADAKPDTKPEITDEAVAEHYGVEPDALKAAVDGAKNGKVTVSQSYLDALNEKAEAGVKALERQDREDRDEAIKAAQNAGKIGRDEKTVASWQRDWQRDPEATKAELDKLPARFPVGKGQDTYAGSDGEDGEGTQYQAAAAEAEARFGIPKEALVNG